MSGNINELCTEPQWNASPSQCHEIAHNYMFKNVDHFLIVRYGKECGFPVTTARVNVNKQCTKCRTTTEQFVPLQPQPTASNHLHLMEQQSNIELCSHASFWHVS